MKKVLIVTGGSGGHVIPALSIYDHLKNDFIASIVQILEELILLIKININMI